MSHINDTARIAMLREHARHVAHVQDALARVAEKLERRGRLHDLSKFLDDEFEGYAKLGEALRFVAYGTPEYQAAVEARRGTVNLHFLRNSHHPEHPKLLGAKAGSRYVEFQHDLTFLDVIEMVCDWWGAWKRPGDCNESWRNSAEKTMSAKRHLLTQEQAWLAEQVVDFLAKEGFL